MNKSDLKPLLSYLKERTETLSSVCSHYEVLDRDRGYLTTDEEVCYTRSTAQLYEVNRVVDVLETLIVSLGKRKHKSQKRKQKEREV